MPDIDREFKVYRIENGTVIDHIPHWRAYQVLEILGLRDGDDLVTVGFGLRSQKMGRKDLLKVENRELTPSEIDRISLVAPQATIDVIRASRIVDKRKVRLPDEFDGLVRCGNLGCITRHEPVPPRFRTLDRTPVRVECRYCAHVTEGDDLEVL